jgi:hypothetical protein
LHFAPMITSDRRRYTACRRLALHDLAHQLGLADAQRADHGHDGVRTDQVRELRGDLFAPDQLAAGSARANAPDAGKRPPRAEDLASAMLDRAAHMSIGNHADAPKFAWREFKVFPGVVGAGAGPSPTAALPCAPRPAALRGWGAEHSSIRRHGCRTTMHSCLPVVQ